MLCDMGHKVECASDGPGLLRKLSAAPADYDLIITDYAMPLLSGTDVLKQAREIRPGMPGIIISGYADSRSIARHGHESVVLTKPFTLNQMKNAIGAIGGATREPVTPI
jgi:DNA-binding NtrC family response regulator